jgi:alpha-mannosidase
VIKYLWRLIWGDKCNHKWKILTYGQITDSSIPCGTYYNMQCEHCGDVKRKNLMT